MSKEKWFIAGQEVSKNDYKAIMNPDKPFSIAIGAGLPWTQEDTEQLIADIAAHKKQLDTIKELKSKGNTYYDKEYKAFQTR